MDEKDILKMKVEVDDSELKEVIEKIEEFNNLLKKANSLADELANKEIVIKVTTN